MVPIPAYPCARPSGTFPKARCLSGLSAGPPCLSGLAVGWRSLVLLAAVLLGACAREARAVRLPSEPGTEIYRISCRSEVEPCRDKAAVVCNGEYEVLENAGVPIEPTRVSSAPGPRSTGSRYQRPDWVGELVVVCGAARAEPLARESAVSTSPSPVAARAPLPDQLCIPGVTQLCLGSAACRGAQACLADGRGYGPCDCGTSPTSDAGTAR
jgi:hypothetical protein